MSKVISEFKTFIKRGNVFDLAVGIIIGGAFGKIVSSFVSDIFTPVISLVLGKVDLAELRIILTQATETDPELAIRYGMFIQAFIDFILIALVVFFLVRMMNRMKKKEVVKPAAPPAPSAQEVLLAEIRDLLKQDRTT
ncbi:MAG: large-conductance mechanosensitive channel protein MscL [Clostridia bacterium]